MNETEQLILVMRLLLKPKIDLFLVVEHEKRVLFAPCQGEVEKKSFN